MDITEQQQQLIDDNGGKLPPELAAQLLEQALDGDTANAENGSQPATTQEQEQANTPKIEPTAQQQPDESQLNDENAVVLAKDGKHTIPFERLANARKGEQEWKQKYEDAQSELAKLQTDAQQRIDNGETPTTQDNQVAIAQKAIDEGVDPAIFGDFSEKALAEGIQKVVDMRVSAMVDQRLKEALAPFQQQQALSAEQAHFTEIFTAHPDAESIVESKEFNDWMSAQPGITQSAYQSVLNGGTALGNGNLVHPVGAYLEYELSGISKNIEIGVKTTQSGNEQVFFYKLPQEQSNHLTNGRVLFGRGLRGRHFSFEIKVNGDHGYINDINIDIAATKRRV